MRIWPVLKTMLFPAAVAAFVACSGGTGETSATGGTTADGCGPNTCGPCPGNCDPVDVCREDGNWSCTCDCGDTTSTTNPTNSTTVSGTGTDTAGTSEGTTGDDCGPSPCGACEPGCTPVDQCVDGNWQCACDCPDPSETSTTTGTETDGDTEGDPIMCLGDPPSFPTFEKMCETVNDCALVFHTIDCCGNEVAWGINASELDAFNEAEAICDMQYPDCDCPVGPILAEDGNSGTPQLISVDCIDGACMSYVAG